MQYKVQSLGGALSLFSTSYRPAIFQEGGDKFFLTSVGLVGFQEPADEQVNSTDGVVFPFAQRSDKMFHVFLQVSEEKRNGVRNWRFDDGRDGLETTKAVHVIASLAVKRHSELLQHIEDIVYLWIGAGTKQHGHVSQHADNCEGNWGKTFCVQHVRIVSSAGVAQDVT